MSYTMELLRMDGGSWPQQKQRAHQNGRYPRSHEIDAYSDEDRAASSLPSSTGSSPPASPVTSEVEDGDPPRVPCAHSCAKVIAQARDPARSQHSYCKFIPSSIEFYAESRNRDRHFVRLAVCGKGLYVPKPTTPSHFFVKNVLPFKKKVHLPSAVKPSFKARKKAT